MQCHTPVDYPPYLLLFSETKVHCAGKGTREVVVDGVEGDNDKIVCACTCMLLTCVCIYVHGLMCVRVYLRACDTIRFDSTLLSEQV